MNRWARQTILAELGDAGQQRLADATVLCIGTGALGSPATMYLAAAGVGKLVIADPDRVEASNLQRQILHGESFIGQAKIASARARLLELNPELELVLHDRRFTPQNAMEFSLGCDVIVDGSDNFPTRFLTNDTAFFRRIPLIHGAIHRFEGQMTVFAPHLGGPCYRCLLPTLPAEGTVPNCAEAGVIGALPGIVGSLQAMEALKCIAGMGCPALGKLLCYDALMSTFRTLTLRPDPDCNLCGRKPTIFDVSNSETNSTSTCDMNPISNISACELHQRLAGNTAITLIDVREPEEHAQAAIAGSMLIPLGTLKSRLEEIPSDSPIVVHCKSGGRSAKAAQLLTVSGFNDVSNLSGGIDSWLAENLPTIP